MKIKINYLKFQRNGVQGEPFYHCLATVKDDIKREMVITFTTQKNDDKTINWGSCRAVCLNEPEQAWRGDTIAYELQKELSKQMAVNGCDIYDFCTKQIY